jgi:hypothetical protein
MLLYFKSCFPFSAYFFSYNFLYKSYLSLLALLHTHIHTHTFFSTSSNIIELQQMMMVWDGQIKLLISLYYFLVVVFSIIIDDDNNNGSQSYCMENNIRLKKMICIMSCQWNQIYHQKIWEDFYFHVYYKLYYEQVKVISCDRNHIL